MSGVQTRKKYKKGMELKNSDHQEFVDDMIRQLAEAIEACVRKDSPRMLIIKPSDYKRIRQRFKSRCMVKRLIKVK